MKMPFIDRLVLGALRWRLERFYSPGLADGACELFTFYCEQAGEQTEKPNYPQSSMAATPGRRPAPGSRN
jgi:hypothetical protein